MRPTATRRVFGIALLVPVLTFLTPAPLDLPAAVTDVRNAAEESSPSSSLAMGDVPTLGSDILPLDGGLYADGLTVDDGLYGDSAAYDEAGYDTGYDLGYDSGYVAGTPGSEVTTLPDTTLSATTTPPATLPNTGSATPPPAGTYQQGYDKGYAEGLRDAQQNSGGGNSGSNNGGNGSGSGGNGSGSGGNGSGGNGSGGNGNGGNGSGGNGSGQPGTPPPYVQPAPPIVDGQMPGITVQGDSIVRGGERWWLAGYNSFVWSGDCGNPDERMSAEQVDAWFASMRRDGHGGVRLFFFDGWDIDRLDAAVASARRWNVYLTITLDDAIAGCGESEKDAGWFGDASETATFERHMRTLLERYEGETAIAWFEFFNEPDGENGALRAFYDRMGAIADTIDPTRLFSSGTVAPYWVDGNANFLDIHRSPGVDIASLHEYDADEAPSNHADDVQANAAGKPVIAGEFGIYAAPDRDCAADDGVAGFAERATRFQDKLAAYTGPGWAGGFGWAWQPGGSGCEYGNLDADGPTQAVFRTFQAGDAPIGATVLFGPPVPPLTATTAPAPAAPVVTPTRAPVPAPSSPAPAPPVATIPPTTRPVTPPTSTSTPTSAPPTPTTTSTPPPTSTDADDDPETSDPGTSDLGTSDPETSDPGTSDPDTSDPDTSGAGTSEADTSGPESSDPGTGAKDGGSTASSPSSTG